MPYRDARASLAGLMRRTLIGLAAFFAMAAPGAAAGGPGPSFADSLSAYCGQAFEGRVVSTDLVDEDWRRARLVVHVRDCGPDGFRLPLAVGDDRSRTWVLSRQGPGGQWELRHIHLHEDGQPDALTLYGGLSVSAPEALRQEFPADPFTKDLFDAGGIPVSKQNIWAVELDGAAQVLAYELRRPGRFFRVEMDLSAPVAPPPPHWGSEAPEAP